MVAVNVVQDVIRAEEEVEEAIAFANSIVIDAQNTVDDDYTIILTA